MDPKYDQQPLEPQQGPQEEKTVEKSSDDLFYWLNALTTALVVLVLVFTFCGRLTRVDGPSMDNTLQHNELLLVWSLGYKPQQGDIVVLNKTTATHLGGVAIVKRVIAVGGQTVDIDYSTGTVYVDGEPLDEPYIKEPMVDIYGSRGSTHIEVPEAPSSSWATTATTPMTAATTSWAPLTRTMSWARRSSPSSPSLNLAPFNGSGRPLGRPFFPRLTRDIPRDTISLGCSARNFM